MSYYALDYDRILDEDSLIQEFEEKYVLPSLELDWVKIEIQNGRTRKEMEDLLWGDYEIWAMQHLIERRQQYID